MNKNIGFRRNIFLDWLDAAAAFRVESCQLDKMRAHLDPIVGLRIESSANRRMALEILINIWGRSATGHPTLHAQALDLYRSAASAQDRLWLHYGMTLLAYPFFRQGVVVIGQLSRFNDTVAPKDVKKRMIAEFGNLGALEKATERILFSLRSWGILLETETVGVSAPVRRHFAASTGTLEEWLLAATLTAHPAEEIPFADLLRLPELFPFCWTISLDVLRQSPWFEVQRQGSGWDMVRLAQTAPYSSTMPRKMVAL